MVRQKGKVLMLCLLTLITVMCSHLTVNAEEKLLEVDDGIFVNDELSDVTWGITGKYVASNSYKFVYEYDGKYYYNYDSTTDTYSETDTLDDAIKGADVYKNGDSVAILSNAAGMSVYEYFVTEYEKCKLHVYDEGGTEKYSIKYTDLTKYLGNTTKTVNASLKCVSNVTDSAGNVLAKTYSVSGGTPTMIELSGTGGNYSFQNEMSDENYTFAFYGADGDYSYTIYLSDGYTATGTLTQSGIYTGQGTDALGDDFPTANSEVTNPKLTVSGIPTKKCSSFELKISSDIDAQITFNGDANEKYQKSAKFTVDSNGTFYYSASTADGGYTEGTVEVKCIDESADSEDWEPADWNGDGISSDNPKIVQTGIFSSFKIFRYIGAVLVLLGIGILVAKKKGFKLKGGHQA